MFQSRIPGSSSELQSLTPELARRPQGRPSAKRGAQRTVRRHGMNRKGKRHDDKTTMCKQPL